MMNPTTLIRLYGSFLFAVTVLLSGCDDASRHPVQADSEIATNESEPLPEWLKVGPKGWDKKSWLEYQSSLIELRKPILRKGDYRVRELKTVTAEVEHWPGEYEDKIKKEWIAKWSDRLDSFERTGGCGCCNEIYTVTGPKAAIEEFPVPKGRRQYFPRFIGVGADK